MEIKSLETIQKEIKAAFDKAAKKGTGHPMERMAINNIVDQAIPFVYGQLLDYINEIVEENNRLNIELSQAKNVVNEQREKLAALQRNYDRLTAGDDLEGSGT